MPELQCGRMPFRWGGDEAMRRPSEVAGFRPLVWRAVVDRVLYGRVDFFRAEQHHCAYARASRRANGNCNGRGTLVVRQVGNDEGVVVAEGKVEALEPSADALNRPGHGVASTASTRALEALNAFYCVRRFEQELRHLEPRLCGVR